MSKGAKAEGLYLLPMAWTPTFRVASPDIIMDESADFGVIAGDALSHIPASRLIIRSSAVFETLADRGRFESIKLETSSAAAIEEALATLREQGKADKCKMGAVIQAYKTPTMKGHLSNEHRVSKTRNHWQVEIEHPLSDDFRINSQRDPAPPVGQPISVLNRSLERTLAGVGNWAARTFESRVHIEWVLENSTLWIVQLDREGDAPDAGIDPTKPDQSYVALPARSLSELSGSVVVERWSEHAFPRYRKLKHVSAFQTVVDGRFPQLFVIRGENVESFLRECEPASILRKMIGERLVCRTDLVPEAHARSEGLNLPRTDTLNPEEIEKWISSQLKKFLHHGLGYSDFVFIIHHFIPSIASAWAESSPGEGLVLVDTLWGLPDGLQYLEHDRFEWDTRLNILSTEHITYKDSFLQEGSDGVWSVRPVRRSLARQSSVSRKDIAFIARATKQLAESVGHQLRVMWFVGTQSGADVASAIPWFCHRPESATEQSLSNFELVEAGGDRSHLKRLPRLDIRGPSDLIVMPAAPHLLRLIPEPVHMRDNAFLESLGVAARAGGHAIEMMGSGLAHAYYILARSGAPIVVPSQRGRVRARRLRTFGKLVRDRIPEKITRGGEQVRVTQVQSDDRRQMLLAKILEEVAEVSEASNKDDFREELADILEVVRSLASNEDVEWQELEQAADAKVSRLGSFRNGVVLLSTAASGLARKGRSAEPALARIIRDGSTTIIPHLALIGDNVETTIAGVDLRISFAAEGIVIEELGPASDDGQLRLKF